MTRLTEKHRDLRIRNNIGTAKSAPIKKHRINEEQIDKPTKEKINKTLKSDFPVKERYSIWDALVAWRDNILSSSFLRVTKINYLSRMQKMIEASVINPTIKLRGVNEAWFDECVRKINDTSWSEKTKISRKTCLSSFYKFAQTFDPDYTNQYEMLSYRYIPTPHEIKNRFNIENSKKLLLSSAREDLLTNGLDIQKLYNTIRKNNERDAWIIALMLETGCALDEILKIKKSDVSSTYVRIENFQYAVPLSLIDGITTLYKDSSEYVFTTRKEGKVGRVQVTRNLKKAGREIGLTFDLTPMVFHRLINTILLRDKRSPLEKYLC